jgi:hypothetical protein
MIFSKGNFYRSLKKSHMPVWDTRFKKKGHELCDEIQEQNLLDMDTEKSYLST